MKIIPNETSANKEHTTTESEENSAHEQNVTACEKRYRRNLFLNIYNIYFSGKILILHASSHSMLIKKKIVSFYYLKIK